MERIRIGFIIAMAFALSLTGMVINHDFNNKDREINQLKEEILALNEELNSSKEMAGIEKTVFGVQKFFEGIDHATGFVADCPPTGNNHTVIGVWSNPDTIVYIAYVNGDELYAWYEMEKS